MHSAIFISPQLGYDDIKLYYSGFSLFKTSTVTQNHAKPSLVNSTASKTKK